MIRPLILIFRVVFFAVATFGFVVLFDHGPKNYLQHALDDLSEWTGLGR